jgi:hypothetical protein
LAPALLARFLSGSRLDPQWEVGGRFSATHHLLETSRKRWILLLQGFELVKQGIDNQRLQKERKHADRQSDQPEIKPPTAGTPPGDVA